MPGETILLLHAASFSSQMWADIDPLLDGYEVWAPDLPGHGTNKGTPFVSIEVTADYLADKLRDHLDQGQKVVVVGLSLGAYVGFALAERHPDLVERCLLCGLQITGIEQAKKFKFLVKLMAPLFNIRSLRQKNYQSIGLDASSRLIDWNGPAPSSTSTVKQVLQTSVDFKRSRDQLQAMSTPTLVIAAQYDQPANVTSLAILNAHLPNCEAYKLPDATLFWPLMKPDLFASILTQWLRDEPLTEQLEKVQSAEATT